MANPSDSVEDYFKQAQAPAPSGGGLPQPGEPLPDVAKRDANKLKFAVPVAIFLVILVGGYFLLGGSKQLKVDVGRAAIRFLNDIGQGEYPKAYAQFADAYKRTFTLPAMSETWAGDPLHWLIDEVEVKDVQFVEETAITRCLAIVTNDRVKAEVFIDVKLVKEGGSWKVIGFSFP